MIINGIISCCNNTGIGQNNTIPWNFNKNLNKFKQLTTGHGIIV
jgi:dihydrofolate reductase